MPIQGDIQTFSLSAIGRMIHAEKKTGILNVSSDGSVTRIYFKQGGIVFISGDLAEELSLGALLKADKLVQEVEIQNALEIGAKSNKRLGVILIEQGYVTKEDLVKVLNLQFKEAISKALTWKEGTFVYTDGLDGYVEDIQLDMDPIRLVAEAERWKEYRILIPHDQVVFEMKDVDLRSNSLSTEGVYDVLLLADGNRTVAQIIQSTGKTRIAVYRALTSLFVQGIIKRKKTSEDIRKGQQISAESIMRFFLPLIKEIVSDFSTEMGGKKAASILADSIKSLPHYDTFLQEVRPEDTTNTMVNNIRERMGRSSKPVKSTDLATGLRNTIVQILKEEHRLLGPKAVNGTLRRMGALIEGMPAEQKIIAGSFMPFLAKLFVNEKSSLETEDIFARSTSSGAATGGTDSGIPTPNLSEIGGAVIIAFYSRIAQILITDLEENLGVKSHALLDKILRNSKYHEEFLCRFRASDDIATNVENIRHHISNEGYRLSKMSFIKGFQEALIELLLEERRLLGDKPTRTSLSKLNRFMSDQKQRNLLPLSEYFVSTLEAHRLI
ncbi:MAG: DUF4388 domain-containing protein, partial [Desulfobacterales bacterium]|nr:DUF4388 domain-containing protein [Desulfobacterales bacterium]MDX2511847.1 DUF4388 domain-containing protein [Desulfobacterales bacterium]